jgi:mannose-6-phosphate isomerase-like protein (cupin superfamily)
MKKLLITITTIIGCTAFVLAQESMPPAMYYSAGEISSDVGASIAERPTFGVGRINSADDYNINMIRRMEPAGAIVHPEGTEIHYIVEGAGVLTTGGVAVRPQAGGPANIEGGYSQRVTVGDLVLIPAGTPHQYTAVEGVVGYLEVRYQTSAF